MRETRLEMKIESKQGRYSRSWAVGALAGARYVGRDMTAVRCTLDAQLAHDGFYTSATRTNPSIFRIGRYLLTQDAEFEVQGPLTGGEAEVVAIRDGGEIFISVGSDQCDREIAPLFPDKPKQMCPHPIATVAWSYTEVKDHWDQLRIYGEVFVAGHGVPLQDAALAELVDLEYLLTLPELDSLPDALVLYCGAAPFLTVVAEDAIARHGLPEETAQGIGERFLVRLHDPVLERTIEHHFAALPLGDELAERRFFRRRISKPNTK